MNVRNCLTKKQKEERLALHEEGLRRCTRCDEVKPLAEFYKQKDGYLGRMSHCKACRFVSGRKYRQNNRELINTKAREYLKRAPERVKNSSKRYRERNEEKVREREHKYREKNKEKINEERRKYYAKNREKELLANREYYASNRHTILDKAKDRTKIYREAPTKIECIDTSVNVKNPYYKAFMAEGILSVKCYFCGNYFTPKYKTVRRFLYAKEGLSNIYCSDECKMKCSSFNQKYNVIHPDSIQYIEPDAKQKARACQSNQLKQLQVDEYGYNFCEKCSKEVEIVELHHTLPVAEYGQEAINSASHLLLCTECHKELTKECRKI